MNYDILLVGVGGQGVLTIGQILAETAMRKGIPVSYYPAKGMAQRGGFVKAQVRLGREGAGPNIPEKGADLVVAMEVSEALKAVRFVKPGGTFVLFGHIWAPTAVMLGKDPYPVLDQVKEQVEKAKSNILYLDPDHLPILEDAPVPANVYVLGAVTGHTELGGMLLPPEVLDTIQTRWARGAEHNRLAFQAGLENKEREQNE